MYEVIGKYTTALITANDLDDVTMSQIRLCVNNAAFTTKMVFMPDTHAGAGVSIIGLTMPISSLIIPEIISTDIDCGMLMMKISSDWHSGTGTDSQNPEIDRQIREVVPFGANVRNSSIFEMRKFEWEKLSTIASKFEQNFNAKFETKFHAPEYSYKWFETFCKRTNAPQERIERSLGTLGGGNHFIELGQTSRTGDITITIHTGSRKLGEVVCTHWQKMAQNGIPKFDIAEWIERVKLEHQKTDWNTQIKRYHEVAYETVQQPKGLGYLVGESMFNYFCDMIFAQEYARKNRQLIAEFISHKLKFNTEESIETPHNYIDFNDWIIRKGAIKSYTGTKMIIPLNMTDGILICEGKSNPEWNFSAPHGAGRIGSRSYIKSLFNAGALTQEDLENSMIGVYSAGIPVDEYQGAYKDAETIERLIEPTATILEKSKPFMSLKDLDGAKLIHKCPVKKQTPRFI